MIFSPQIISIFVLNFIFVVFASIVFVISYKIYRNWNSDSTSQSQYKLEKDTVLSSTIIYYIFVVKIPLFLYFVFVLDSISNILTGAMCAAGVVDATVYGNYLFILKILNLYLFGLWIILHKFDISKEELPYTKLKFGIYLIIYTLLMAEIVIETLMFTSIDPSRMVSCCGALYSSTANSYIGNLFVVPPIILVSVFYGNFILLLLFYRLKMNVAYGIFAILFLVVSILSLILFFGTYIYELPTHHCPFCFLQKDYYYIGYLIYATLFGGTFYGVASIFFGSKNYMKNSMVLIVLYSVIVSFYPISYYLKNGVWL